MLANNLHVTLAACISLSPSEVSVCQRAQETVGRTKRLVVVGESAALPLDETIDYFQAQAALHGKALAA
jgi:hypothetical protein